MSDLPAISPPSFRAWVAGLGEPSGCGLFLAYVPLGFQLRDIGLAAVDDCLNQLDHSAVVREAHDLPELLNSRLHMGKNFFVHDARPNRRPDWVT